MAFHKMKRTKPNELSVVQRQYYFLQGDGVACRDNPLRGKFCSNSFCERETLLPVAVRRCQLVEATSNRSYASRGV